MNYESTKKLYLSKGYKFREEKMALNLHGIRSRFSQSDKFDDLGGIAWIDENGEKQHFNFWMTTDPGKYYLQNPMDKNGCIIMIPGQYIEVYGRGLHNGKYECFKQVRKMEYVRDNNKDTLLDFDLYRDPIKRAAFAFWGINGTNFHRAHINAILKWIGRYSAGCQVAQRPETFKKLIDLRDKSVKFGYSFWDYTLFEEGFKTNYAKLAA